MNGHIYSLRAFDASRPLYVRHDTFQCREEGQRCDPNDWDDDERCCAGLQCDRYQERCTRGGNNVSCLE